MTTSRLLFASVVLAAPLLLLGACETAEGYRQKMTGWQGRTGDELLVDWGSPRDKSTLSDGRQVWSYTKRQDVTSGGYTRTDTRQVSRTVTDKDGKKRTETINETFPVYVPQTTTTVECTTRFVLSPPPALRVQEVRFEGDGCVAPEQ